MKKFKDEFMEFNFDDSNAEVIMMNIIKSPVIMKSGKKACQVNAKFETNNELVEALNVLEIEIAIENKLIGSLKTKGKFIHFKTSAQILNN